MGVQPRPHPYQLPGTEKGKRRRIKTQHLIFQPGTKIQRFKMPHCKTYGFVLGNAASCSPALPLPASVDAPRSDISQIRYQNTQELKYTSGTYYLDSFPKSLPRYRDWRSLSSAQAVQNLSASLTTNQPRKQKFLSSSKITEEPTAALPSKPTAITSSQPGGYSETVASSFIENRR